MSNIARQYGFIYKILIPLIFLISACSPNMGEFEHAPFKISTNEINISELSRKTVGLVSSFDDELRVLSTPTRSENNSQVISTSEFDPNILTIQVLVDRLSGVGFSSVEDISDLPSTLDFKRRLSQSLIEYQQTKNQTAKSVPSNIPAEKPNHLKQIFTENMSSLAEETGKEIILFTLPFVLV